MPTTYFSIRYWHMPGRGIRFHTHQAGFASDPLFVMLQLQHSAANAFPDDAIHNSTSVVYSSLWLPPTSEYVSNFIRQGQPLIVTGIDAIGVMTPHHCFFFDNFMQADYNRMLMEHTSFATKYVPEHVRQPWLDALHKKDGSFQKLLIGLAPGQKRRPPSSGKRRIR